MASSKFLVVLALFFTCLSLANSAPFWTKPWEQTEMVNPNDDIDTAAKEPEQLYGGGYSTGRCRNGCCYGGRYVGCIGCCRHPDEETCKSVAAMFMESATHVVPAAKSQRKLRKRKLLQFGLRADPEKGAKPWTHYRITYDKYGHFKHLFEYNKMEF